jgi:cytochrome c-type biogenesis protein
VIDPQTAVLEAFAHPTLGAFASIFCAGLITSIGPCVAPRYIAITALTGTERRAVLPIGVFATGLLVAYVSLGWVSGALGFLVNASAVIYAVLATGLIVGGLWTLAGRRRHHAHSSTPPQSLGAVLLLGMASAFVASPCCTPIVASVVSYSAIVGKPTFGAMLLFFFALGHIAPLAAVAFLGGPLRATLVRLAHAQAPAIASGVLMLALGLLYGVLV